MFKTFAAILFAIASSVSVAETYTAGKDYAEIKNPVRTVDANKIEVNEVFWYGCPHCNDFSPIFSAWSEKLPEDVAVEHTPAIWNGRMKTHAQIFYTAKALGVLDQLHSEAFNAMHVQKRRLTSDKDIYALFAKHGISEETFNKMFNSFGIKSQVQQADARARGYGIAGTPEVIVNGKYRVTASMAGGQANMIKVATFLIEKERAAMK